MGTFRRAVGLCVVVAASGCGSDGGGGGGAAADAARGADAAVGSAPDAGVGAVAPLFEETATLPADSPLTGTAGIAVTAFDYDGDGDQDLLVTRGFALIGSRPLSPILLANDGHGHFTDVSAASGLDVPAIYGTAAAFDYDNDGDLDLYLSVCTTAGDGVVSDDGPDRLYRNDGHGHFTDVSEASGVAAATHACGASTAVADIDNDGDLDVYVANAFDIDVWTPPHVPDDPDVLLVNQGDGTFRDEASERGVLGFPDDGVTLSALFVDWDGDGDMDLLPAYEYGHAKAFENDGTGHFTEASARLGLNALGFGGWMCWTPVDLDGDGGFELVGANFGTSMLLGSPVPLDRFPADFNPFATVLKFDGGTFRDIAGQVAMHGFGLDLPATAPVRPAPDTFAALPWAWAVSAADVDADGAEDLYWTGAGAVTSNAGIVGTTATGAYPTLLLRQTGPQAFEDQARALGVADDRASDGYFFPAWGNTYADFDGNGFLDLVVTNYTLVDLPGSVRVFMNQGNDHHHLSVRLVGHASNRDGIGAVVRVTPAGSARTETRMAYMSGWTSPGGPLYFGLGDATTADVEVRWPSGQHQTLSAVAADRTQTVEEP
jgi:hypothetical protein